MLSRGEGPLEVGDRRSCLGSTGLPTFWGLGRVEGTPGHRWMSRSARPLERAREGRVGRCARGPGEARPSPSVSSQVTGIPMNVSVKLQLSLYIKAVKGIG